ncbi:MAG: DinB family protein [Gemmatimonadetes bacterium]|nr:DinB family protein [Gemmatimonadota bacterium]NNK64094.1 DinB family protein [Gemmatimonadota bacterium]
MAHHAKKDPPRTTADLRLDIEEQSEELASLFQATEDARLMQRPPSGKWSAVEHVDHLAKVNRGYLAALESAVASGRAAGRRGAGPFRGSVIGRFFAASMEPPVKMKVKTLAAMQPDAELAPEPTLAVFQDLQERLLALLREAEGLDLDAIRMASPFMKLLRAPAFSWFVVLTAHNRRHIWLIRQTLTDLDGAKRG